MYFKFNPLPFAEGTESIYLDLGLVEEYVIATALGCDEPESLLIQEFFYGAFHGRSRLPCATASI